MFKNKGIAFLLAVLCASPLAALAQSVREDRFDRTTGGPTYRGQLSDQDVYRKLSVSLTALKLQPGLDEAMADQDSPYQEAYQHIKAACQLLAQYEELRHSNGLSSENRFSLQAKITIPHEISSFNRFRQSSWASSDKSLNQISRTSNLR